jgi:excinuclease UvrABC helicase subunit UvrB
MKKSSEREQDFKNKLIEYFMQFKDCPNMLVDYLCNNDAFKNSFKNKLMKSSILNKNENKFKLGYHEITNDEVAASAIEDVASGIFTSLDDMLDHYDSLLESHNVSEIRQMPPEQKEDIIAMYSAKLDIALEKQKYEEAAKLRDFLEIIKNN